MFSLLLAMLVPTCFGFARYFTGGGGLEAEHQIGYWGIRYMPSTRNSDVLYPMLGCISAFSLTRDSKAGVKQMLLTALALGCAAAVVLSYSRGAWLALGVGLFFLHRQSEGQGVRYRWVGFASVCLGVALAVAFVQSKGPSSIETLQARFMSILEGTSDRGYSNAGRLLLYEETLKGVVLQPWGVGIENFGSLFQGTEFGQQYKVGNAENAYLNIAGEGGVLGVLFFVALLRRLWISLQADQSSGALWSLRAASGRSLMATILVYFLFNDELNSVLVWSVLGIVGALGYSEISGPVQVNDTPRIYSILD
jgi:O-antigen ligase